jgi:cytochrome c oxidase assembly protein subunit 15
MLKAAAARQRLCLWLASRLKSRLTGMEKKLLFLYCCLTAFVTLVLLGIGGMVTSKGAGMSVPDWPTSYGYNMFALPFSHWVGGVFYEHSHRLVASLTGLLTVFLTRWLGGYRSRRALAIVGLAELAAGLALPYILPSQRGTGYFLAGIGGVVLAAALVWARNAPAPKPLPALGWFAFWAVQVQGLLGGLRVVLYKDEIGVFHAALAQIFFIVICVIALLTSPAWREGRLRAVKDIALARWVFVGTMLIFVQLILGASMRHAHAGLAVPDFPLAYGKVWPETSPEAIQRYNAQRIEVFAAKPITATQVNLHMIHRLLAYAILAVVGLAAIVALKRHGFGSLYGKVTILWLGVILCQVGLGIATVLTNKAADIATSHLVAGALSFAFGAVASLILCRELVFIGNLSGHVEQSCARGLGNPSIANERT